KQNHVAESSLGIDGGCVSDVETVRGPGDAPQHPTVDANSGPSFGEIEKLFAVDFGERGGVPLVNQKLDSPGGGVRCVIPPVKGSDESRMLGYGKFRDSHMLHRLVSYLNGERIFLWPLRTVMVNIGGIGCALMSKYLPTVYHPWRPQGGTLAMLVRYFSVSRASRDGVAWRLP